MKPSINYVCSEGGIIDKASTHTREVREVAGIRAKCGQGDAKKSRIFSRHHLCFIPRAAAVVLGSPVEERLVGDVRLVDGVGRDHGFRVGRLKNETTVNNKLLKSKR